MANGQKIVSMKVCPNVKWKMHGQDYLEDLRVLQLGSCDMILGLDWMRKHTLITFDFDNSTLLLKKEGLIIELLGVKEEGTLRMITAGRLQKLIQRKVTTLVGHLLFIDAIPETTNQNCKEQMPQVSIQHFELLQVSFNSITTVEKLIEKYEDIFKEPNFLPPTRSHDHRIPLMPNAIPINIRPYRHSQEQKNEVERLVKEMLSTGIIQASHGPFASSSY